MKNALLLCAVLLASAISAAAQVNSGSNGSDGAFNPTQSVEIDMTDHPDGIYQYTSVKIPTGVTVTFKPNAANTPVVWLVQTTVEIKGAIKLNGFNSKGADGGLGGPGGFDGGGGGGGGEISGNGQGPGGGIGGDSNNNLGGNGSFSTVGSRLNGYSGACLTQPKQALSGEKYGSQFLVPLIGGSGGGGCYSPSTGGGGGGGAILIASNEKITISGMIDALGGGRFSTLSKRYGGGGTGGSIRLFSQKIEGNGEINTHGGLSAWNCGTSYDYPSHASHGVIRMDAFVNSFVGNVTGLTSRGYQPIIIPPANISVSLTIETVGGVTVAQVPSGNLTFPDVIVPAAHPNPVSIVVGCTNIPLGTEIIVDVTPANGSAIRAVGLNSIGTKASSTATVQVQMPRGGGTIQAKAVSGIELAANFDPNAEHLSLAQTGWTADGERFSAVEVTGGLGVSSQLAYVTESGKRYTLGGR